MLSASGSIRAVLLVALAGYGASAPRRDRVAGNTNLEKSALRVEVYRGEAASVNSFLISNGTSVVVLDVQRTVAEARKLADRVRATGLELTDVVISHGHTDHFSGIALFRREFPNARIVAPTAAIKQDIEDYARYMDSLGVLAKTAFLDPSLRPRSPAHPDGFDYQSAIEVLSGDSLRLVGGGLLQITSGYRPTEARHMATIYSAELNALFLADLGYHRVHLWMGDDITLDRVAAWRAELGRIRDRYLSLRPTVYPGHGEPTDLSLVDTMERYIDDYVGIVHRAASRATAFAEMTARYPDYLQADVFLRYSIQHHVP